jgi:hypothetical protein
MTPCSGGGNRLARAGGERLADFTSRQFGRYDEQDTA